jgi:hypothetical protein
MDLQQAWQENKRFLIGALIGLFAFLILRVVVESVFDAHGPALQNQRIASTVNREEYFSQPALAAAEQERDRLAGLQQTLGDAVLFTPSADYLLDGKGAPDLHYEEVARRLRQKLVRGAAELGLDLGERNLSWTAPAGGSDEIRRTLLALGLLDQAASRLLAAHRATLAADENARGVVTIESFKLDPPRAEAPRARGAEPSPVEDHRVSFQFTADYATIVRFLESCRSAQPPLSLESFTLESGRRSNDPPKATGKLLAPVLTRP